MAFGLCERLNRERDLPRSRHSNHHDIVWPCAATRKRVDSARQKAIRDRIVKASHHDRELQSAGFEAAFYNLDIHPFTGKMRVRNTRLWDNSISGFIIPHGPRFYP